MGKSEDHKQKGPELTIDFRVLLLNGVQNQSGKEQWIPPVIRLSGRITVVGRSEKIQAQKRGFLITA